MTKIQNFWLGFVILFFSITLSIIIGSKERIVSKNLKNINTTFVRVENIEPTNHQIQIQGYGSIEPYYKAQVISQATGQIEYILDNLNLGAEISESQLICQLDKSDYNLALVNAESNVVDAKLAVKQEQGRGVVAKLEWDMLSELERSSGILKELMLRQDYLKSALYKLNAANSKLEVAKKNLSNTAIKSPCSGVITEYNLAPNQFISRGQTVASIACNSKLNLLITASQDKISHLFNKDLSKINVVVDNKHKAKIMHILSNLDSKSKMAQILLEFKPNQDSIPPLLGSYVKAIITTSEFINAYKIPEHSVHAESYIWIVENGTLKKINVNIVDKTPNEIVVQSKLLTGNIFVVTSNIAYPQSGMQVEII